MKMKRLFIIIIGIILIFAGCSVQGNQTETSNQPSESKSGNYAEYTNDTSYIKDDSDENVVFDTSVDLPESAQDGELYDFEAGTLNISVDDVSEVFKAYINDGKYNTSEETIEEINYTSTTYTFETKESGDILRLSSNSGLLFTTPYSDAITSLFQYDDRYGNYNADRFTQADLKFMSRTDAINNARSIVGQLGIDVLDDCRNYSLSAAEYEAEMDRQIQEDDTLQDVDELNSIDEWSDCYYMVFNLALDDIAILDKDFSFSSYEGGTIASKVEVIISEEGTELFIAEGLIPINKSSSPQEIITLQQALEALVSSYDLIILSEPLTVTEITMYYMANNDRLIPVYAFKVLQGDTVIWSYFNAFTGEQII